MHDIKIELTDAVGKGGCVKLDGKPVAGCYYVNVHARVGELTSVTIGVFAKSLEVSGLANVHPFITTNQKGSWNSDLTMPCGHKMGDCFRVFKLDTDIPDGASCAGCVANGVQTSYSQAEIEAICAAARQLGIDIQQVEKS